MRAPVAVGNGLCSFAFRLKVLATEWSCVVLLPYRGSGRPAAAGRIRISISTIASTSGRMVVQHAEAGLGVYCFEAKLADLGLDVRGSTGQGALVRRRSAAVGMMMRVGCARPRGGAVSGGCDGVGWGRGWESWEAWGPG